jgi:hypothetical protein
MSRFGIEGKGDFIYFKISRHSLGPVHPPITFLLGSVPWGYSGRNITTHTHTRVVLR